MQPRKPDPSRSRNLSSERSAYRRRTTRKRRLYETLTPRQMMVIAACSVLLLLFFCSPFRSDESAIAPAGAGSNWFSRQQPTPTPVQARAQAVGAAPEGTRNDAQLRTLADQYLTDLYNARLFNGTVLLARNGTVVLSKGYGMADVTRGVENTPKTRFRLASVSKPFTATAIMRLQQQGKIQIAASVCNYLPSCPAAWQPITIHHLLTHTSGLPNYTDFADYEPTQGQPATPEQLLARFNTMPLLFAPGSQYMYENSDFVLLGVIIEQVSGKRYADFMRDEVFGVVGMRDSGFDTSTSTVDASIAQPYSGFQQPARFLDTSTLFSAGGIYSTVEDMYRFDRALYGDGLLNVSSKQAMWTAHASGYGYGWRVTDRYGHRRISHPGFMDGAATAFVRFPDDDITVIVLSNMSSADVGVISDYLAGLAFGD